MENEIKIKKCSKCGEYKPFSDFYKNNQNKTNGLRGRCKVCSIKPHVNNPRPGSKNIDMVNKKFGKLLVLSYFGLSKNNNKIWECQCDCGNITKATTTYLKSGKKTSCGCNRFKKGSDVYNYNGYEDISGTKWYSIKQNAKKRNLIFEITKEGVWEMLLKQDNLCFFSKLPISFKDGTASIDRLDSKLGYTNDNIVLVHKDINRLKTNFDLNYFLFLCRLVANNSNNN